jgi:nicotinamide phosphoribosyltransferase
LWQASTSATIAFHYKKEFIRAAKASGGDLDFVQFQGHDFSMRGLSSLGSAQSSGMGHLLSFVGTDTIPAIEAMEYYYGANIENELVGTSIPASEHSIQCTFGDDMAYLQSMMNDVHPSGFVSIVSDGYDFWDVMTRVIPALKEDIMARDGKVVIRPDSGDPVKIICGTEDAEYTTDPEYKGAVQILWDTFGGTVNDEGFKVLDPHIGIIYGDAITYNRAKEILERLAAKGFASTNVVFGIGSYTYQYNTRDTFEHALKSTAAVINGKEIQIFKDPKTDSGMKTSLRGRVVVIKSGPSYIYRDGLGLKDVILEDELRPIFQDGKLLVDDTFANIKARLASHLGE